MIKYILSVALIISLSIILWITGAFNSIFTKQKLTQHFSQNEQGIADLASYFKQQVAIVKAPTVIFGLQDDGNVSLDVSLDTISKVIRCINVPIGSPKLDSALNYLGWTNETLQTLKEKLTKINCINIIGTNTHGDNPIGITPKQKGWYNYEYFIFDSPLSESMQETYNHVISNSEFGKRVCLVDSPGLE